MAIKRRAVTDLLSDQPMKKDRCSNRDHERILPSSSDVMDTLVQMDTTSESSSITTSPYTAEFFADMASTTGQLFPFEAFAEAHECTVSEVSQAINAMVVAPLSDPTFTWHNVDDLSIAEYGRAMISIWKAHDERKGNGANSPKIVIDTTTADITPSDEIVLSALDKELLGDTSSEDEVDPSGREAPVSHIKEKHRLPNNCISSKSQKAWDQPRKRVKWAPIPTEKEKKERERKKLRDKRRRRFQAGEGLMKNAKRSDTVTGLHLEALSAFHDYP
ncbi:hypothetical protein BDV28DRAFT_127752 [Aspergillus coremiiformis]|uniref:Uncharacterized protein n=1 Tax=Aspergillus coremiiformis TaxID=138285 RepID=A0A5N6ZER6_9EURO|nr:hypothetical protein BDV28DRAFT_127752 [Aspergillus coremiiformis]